MRHRFEFISQSRSISFNNQSIHRSITYDVSVGALWMMPQGQVREHRIPAKVLHFFENKIIFSAGEGFQTNDVEVGVSIRFYLRSKPHVEGELLFPLKC